MPAGGGGGAQALWTSRIRRRRQQGVRRGFRFSSKERSSPSINHRLNINYRLNITHRLNINHRLSTNAVEQLPGRAPASCRSCRLYRRAGRSQGGEGSQGGVLRCGPLRGRRCELHPSEKGDFIGDCMLSSGSARVAACILLYALLYAFSCMRSCMHSPRVHPH